MNEFFLTGKVGENPVSYERSQLLTISETCSNSKAAGVQLDEPVDSSADSDSESSNDHSGEHKKLKCDLQALTD